MKKLFIFTTILLLTVAGHCATRTIADGGGDWSSTGTWEEAAVPTSGDAVEAQGDGTSGNLTVDEAAECASMDLTGYQGDILMEANLTIGGNLIVDGTLTDRPYIYSDTVGTARTITCNGTVTADEVEFEDITGAGSASWDISSGATADCGGNSGITFATADDLYLVTSETNPTWHYDDVWSTYSGGATGARMPLCQDTVIINNDSFNGSATEYRTTYKRHAGVDASALYSGDTLYFGRYVGIYGDFLIPAECDKDIYYIELKGRGDHLVNLHNASVFYGVKVNAYGGTYTFLTGFRSSYAGLDFQRGTLNLGKETYFTFDGTFNSNYTTERTLTMGTGAMYLFNSNFLVNGTNLTVNKGTREIGMIGWLDKSFTGGGKDWYKLRISSSSSSTITIEDSNTFDVFEIWGPRSVLFANGTTTTMGEGSFEDGVSLSAESGSYTLTASDEDIITGDITVSDSTVTPSNKWFAGYNSTDDGDNTGWNWYRPITSNGMVTE